MVLQTFRMSPEINFNVSCIVFSRTGRSLLMADLVVVDLIPPSFGSLWSYVQLQSLDTT